MQCHSFSSCNGRVFWILWHLFHYINHLSLSLSLSNSQLFSISSKERFSLKKQHFFFSRSISLWGLIFHVIIKFAQRETVHVIQILCKRPSVPISLYYTICSQRGSALYSVTLCLFSWVYQGLENFQSLSFFDLLDFKVLVFFYLILTANIALEGVEAVFQHRIVRAYRHRG